VKVRLNKYLASCGLGSRRKVEELILAGKISINGAGVNDLALQVDDNKDLITCEGKPVKSEPQKLYLLLNKPAGYLVTKSDEFDRKTVYKLLPDFAQQCVPAGRLDKDTEGLLLLTNDGDVVQALTHPTKKVEKVYRVQVNSPLTHSQVEELRSGVMVEGYKTRSAGVYIKHNETGNTVLKVVIKEGKKRQIRLMLEAVGRKVLHLKRMQIGEIELGKLPVGMWRLCSGREMSYLRSLTRKTV